MKNVDLLLNEARKIQSELYDENLETKEKITLYKNFIELIRKAAYRGNSEAQFELGQHYEDLNYWGGNPNYNPDKCVYWYTKACDNDHAEACNCLANCYELGEGVEKNLYTALRLFERSAILGSTSGYENHKLLLSDLS